MERLTDAQSGLARWLLCPDHPARAPGSINMTLGSLHWLSVWLSEEGQTQSYLWRRVRDLSINSTSSIISLLGRTTIMSCNRLVDAMEDGEVTTMVCDLEVGRGNL